MLGLGLYSVLVLWLPLCARVGAMLCSCFVAPIVCLGWGYVVFLFCGSHCVLG